MKTKINILLIIITFFCQIPINGKSKKNDEAYQPITENKISAISLRNLNLNRSEYKILKTISAQSIIECEISKNKITVYDPENPDFYFKYKKEKKDDKKIWVLEESSGTIRVGWYQNISEGALDWSKPNPEGFSRHIASYILINIANEMGADGIIEPLFSTNFQEIEKKGKRVLVYKTTARGKIVNLITD